MRNQSFKNLEFTLLEQKLTNYSQAIQRPRIGWLKTIRKTLGMPARYLAKRLNKSTDRIYQLEHMEVKGAVTLKALQEVADAMGCDLVYAFVPKAGLTLTELLEKKASEVAQKRLAAISHTMQLEQQGVEPSIYRKQLEAEKQALLAHKKELWYD